MRELGLWNAERGVDATYAEVAQAAARCRFRDCRHGDEPGCNLRAGIESGDLAADRVAAYQRLQAELAEQPRASAPGAKRRWRSASKAMRRFYRDD
jgi:ribosome biogenesis GTPase